MGSCMGYYRKYVSHNNTLISLVSRNNHEGTQNKRLSYYLLILVLRENYNRKILYCLSNIRHTDVCGRNNCLSCYGMKKLFHLMGTIWNYNLLNQSYELILNQPIVL